MSLCRQQGTLHDASWLEPIVACFPSFAQTPPNALECVLVDFVCASPLSKALVISLATRTIQRCGTSCIQLRGRGIGDDALAALLPHLLECCSRRQGLVDCLRTSSNLSPAPIFAPFVHAHPLVPASLSSASRNECCEACGRSLSSICSGVVCENFGCDFSLCAQCACFLTQPPSRYSLCLLYSCESLQALRAS